MIKNDQYAGIPIYAEAPSRAYTLRTICAGLFSIAALVGGVCCARIDVHFGVTVALTATSAICFLIAKSWERKDRSYFGANRKSIVYRMKDWQGS